jgi:prepilin-type processing-associated H-X9-DG protein
LPADRHGRAGNFSFADGHTERWRWLAPKKFKAVGQEIGDVNDMKDFRRVQAAVAPERRFNYPVIGF